MKRTFIYTFLLISTIVFSQKKFLDNVTVGDNIDNISIGGFTEIKENAECFNCKVYKIYYDNNSAVNGMIINLTTDDKKNIIGLNRISIFNNVNKAVESYDYQRENFKRTYKASGYKFISEKISTALSEEDYYVFEKIINDSVSVYIIRGRGKGINFYEEFYKNSKHKPLGTYKNIEILKKEKFKITQDELDLLKSICQKNDLNRNQCTCFMNNVVKLVTDRNFARIKEMFDKNESETIKELKKIINDCAERY